MSPTGHIAIGFIAKKYTPQTPVWILLLATLLIDLLYGFFSLIGLETHGFAPWSHSLLMALLWSTLTFLLTLLISRKRRVSLVMGLLVFSHWFLDFLVWNNLPVAFDPTKLTGLGFYTNLGFDPSHLEFNVVMIIITLLELAMLAVGIFVYIRVRKHQKIKSVGITE